MSNKKTPLAVTFGAETAAMIVQGDEKIYDTALCTLLGLTRNPPNTVVQRVYVTMKQAGNSTAASILKATCTNGTGDDEETRVIPLLCETSKIIAASGTGAGTLIGQTLQLGGTTTKDWTVRKVTA